MADPPSTRTAASAPGGAPPEAPRTWAETREGRREVPAGLWLRCPACSAMTYRKQVEENLNVCPECDHHYRVDADTRVEQLVDPGSFEPMFDDLQAVDALKFTDRKPYAKRLADARKQTGHHDAIVAGGAYIKGRKVVLGVMDTRFIMASMGSVVGEVVARCAEFAVQTDRPFVLICAAGGARMMESALALMQMAKTSAALARLDDANGLFIPVLTDPTTGGVTASFAMLGDLIIAEPKALIGFAGPRVIANTVREELPEGFQRSEFLLEKGFVDRVVHRHELRNELARLIDYAGK